MCCPAANDKSVAESTSTWIAWCSAGRETWSWARVSLEWAPKKIGVVDVGFLNGAVRVMMFFDKPQQGWNILRSKVIHTWLVGVSTRYIKCILKPGSWSQVWWKTDQCFIKTPSKKCLAVGGSELLHFTVEAAISKAMNRTHYKNPFFIAYPSFSKFIPILPIHFANPSQPGAFSTPAVRHASPCAAARPWHRAFPAPRASLRGQRWPCWFRPPKIRRSLGIISESQVGWK